MDYNLSWSYIKGDRNCFADVLSRTQVSTQEAPEFPRTTNVEVKRVTEGAGEKTICREMEIMAIQASDDKLYQEIIKAVQEGKEVSDYPKGHEINAFFGVWGELGIEETRAGPLVTVGGRLLVPEASRLKVIENLHICHPG